jgi:hypothetical protein
MVGTKYQEPGRIRRDQVQEMFLWEQNSNYDPRKRQPISKVHKKGDSLSKVVLPEV